MIGAWLLERRRRRWMARPFPSEWRAILEADLAHWAILDDTERHRLEGLTQAFIHTTAWRGDGGLVVDDRMKVLIAAQACLLLLGLETTGYARVRTVFVFPGRYLLRGTGVNDTGEVDADRAALGHTSLRGPIVLSWPDVLAGARNAGDGRNVVIHEFAHKLDMLDGLVDGTPPLPCPKRLRAWVTAMTPAWESLVEAAQEGRKTFLDPYGATNVGEFFAVATEAFFEKALPFRATEPAVYAQLVAFYGQDPAARSRHVQGAITTSTPSSG